MPITVSEMMRCLEEMHIDTAYSGRREASVDGFCSIKNPKPRSLTWIKTWEQTSIESIDPALDLVVVADVPVSAALPQTYNVIRCGDPKAAFFGLLSHFFAHRQSPGIASTAIVETSAVGKNVSIGHHCYIGPEVSIGDDVTIEHNVSILCAATIGDNTIIHSGVVIGTDGYGYYADADGRNQKVAHFGGVTIESDVEIGANTCIDRGTIDNTYIGKNVKIDNLCHIGHNAVIEENVLVIALSFLGGSSLLKRDSYIAPGVMVMNQVTVGEHAMAGMGAVVTKDVPDNMVVVGMPAKILRENG